MNPKHNFYENNQAAFIDSHNQHRISRNALEKTPYQKNAVGTIGVVRFYGHVLTHFGDAIEASTNKPSDRSILKIHRS
jgi:hypothetical protein